MYYISDLVRQRGRERLGLFLVQVPSKPMVPAHGVNDLVPELSRKDNTSRCKTRAESPPLFFFIRQTTALIYPFCWHIQRPVLARRWKSLGGILPKQLRYPLTDPGRMEALSGLGGKSEPEAWFRAHTTAGISSDSYLSQNLYQGFQDREISVVMCAL